MILIFLITDKNLRKYNLIQEDFLETFQSLLYQNQ